MSLESIPPESSQFLILSEKDQKFLEQSSKNVIEKILADFPNTLPRAVIFPDTSARPLAHLFLPILRKVASERGEEIPKLYFFQSVHCSLDQNTASKNFKDRAAEIQTYSGEPSTISKILSVVGMNDKQSEIIIVDDYVSADANTIGIIRSAFKQQLPAYALIGEVTYFPQSAKISIGLADPYASSAGRLSSGFEYRTTEGQSKHPALGVKKEEDSKYVSAEPHEDGVKDLRADMKVIGEKIAQDL